MNRKKSPLRFVADSMTIGNGLCGFLAITIIADLLHPGTVPVAYAAAGLVGLGTVLDAMDGVVARHWGSSGRGATLDLMSDSTTFVVAPALLVLQTQGNAFPLLTLMSVTALVFAGMWRLARNISSDDHLQFLGVPVSWSGPSLVIAVLLTQETSIPDLFLPILVSGMAALNVSRIKYPKTQGKGLTLVVGTISAAGLLVVLGFTILPQFRGPILAFSASLAFVVVFLSPLLAPLFRRAF